MSGKSILLIRTIAGAVYGALVICSVLFSRYLFLALILFMTVALMSEYYNMALGKGKMKLQRALAFATAVTFVVTVFCIRSFGIAHSRVSLTMLPLFAMMFSSLSKTCRADFANTSHLFTALVWFALPMGLSSILVLKGGVFNGVMLLCFLVIDWMSDIGAYAFGMLLGQKPGSKKLAPEISPKKSWVGFWGGVGMAVATAWALNALGYLEMPLVFALLLGAIMSVAGVAGDLYESMWKRSHSLKDSGNIIPGHGGMMDRLDSVLFAIPAGSIFLALFNLL